MDILDPKLKFLTKPDFLSVCFSKNELSCCILILKKCNGCQTQSGLTAKNERPSTVKDLDKFYH